MVCVTCVPEYAPMMWIDAMAAGATPEKAVELASQLVDGSHLMGEEVHVEILETRKGKKSPQKGTQ